MKTPSVVAWMVLAIGVVAALAYWDERREAAAALNDFGEEQATLARGVSAALGTELAASPRGTPTELLARTASVEVRGALRVLLQTPTSAGFFATDGSVVRSPAIEAALDRGAPWVRLTRADAADLGLPARAAIAGLRAIDAGVPGKWRVAVVATAQRQRDREQRAELRLVLGVVVASGLVLAFGGLAYREQRRALELASDLAIAEIQNERNARLVRADKLATMGALATGIAHEVATPLGVILGRAEQLLPRVTGDEKSTRAVEAIVAQAERIDGIVRGFLGLVRGSSPRLERVDPAGMAEASLDLVRHRFTRAGVNLTHAIDPDLPRVACEPRLFEQVLVNLLLNACDACEAGGSAELSVRAQGKRVVFSVTDDGVGITPEAAARAMDEN